MTGHISFFFFFFKFEIKDFTVKMAELNVAVSEDMDDHGKSLSGINSIPG